MPPTATAGRVVVEIGVDVADVGRQLTAAERLLTQTGTRMYFLGSRIGVGFGLPLTAAAAAIAKFGLEFDQAMTESLAIMRDISPAIRAEMEKTAKSITQETKYSATEAAKAYYYLASAGLNAQQVIKALPVATKFAQAAVIDLAKASEYLTDAQNLLGLRTEDASQNMLNMARVSDVLVEANNLAQGTTEQFAQALVSTRGKLRELNIDVEQGVAVLMAYASVGRKGTVAGTQLYMVLRDLQKAVATQSKTWKSLKLEVYDANDEVRPFVDILEDLEVRLAGMSDKQRDVTMRMLGFTDRSKGALTTILGLSGKIREYTAALYQAGGATERVAKNQMMSLQNRLISLGNQLKVKAIDVFLQFKPVIEQYVIPAGERLLGFLDTLIRRLESMSVEQKAFIAFLVTIPMVLGPVIMILGSFFLALRGLAAPVFALVRLWANARLEMAAYFAALRGQALAGALSQGAMDYTHAPGMGAWSARRVSAGAANAVSGAVIYDAWGRKIRSVEVGAAVAAPKVGRLATLLAEATARLGPLVRLTGWWAAAIVGAGGLIWALSALVGMNERLEAAVRRVWDSFKAGAGQTLDDTATNFGNIADAVEETTMAFVEMVRAGVQGDKVLFRIGQLLDYIASRDVKTGIESLGVSLGSTWSNAFKNMMPLLALLDWVGAGAQKGANVAGGLRQKFLESQGKGRPTVPIPGIFATPAAPFPVGYQPPTVTGQIWGPQDDEYYDELDLRSKKEQEYAEKVENLRKELLGLGGDDLKLLRDAWKGLTSVQQSSVDVLLTVWDRYSKIREQLQPGAYPAELERATAQNVEFVRVLNEVASQETWEKIFGGLGELNSEAKDWVIHADMISSEFTQMKLRGEDTSEIFKAHGKVFESLTEIYDRIPANLQAIVEEYWAWKAVVSKFSPEHEEMLRKASQSLDDYLEKAEADYKDALTNRLLISEGYADQELSGLKKGLAEQARVMEEAEIKALGQLMMFSEQENKAEYDAQLEKFRTLQKFNRDRLAEMTREGLLRLLKAVGVNEEILRNERKFTDEELKEMYIRLANWVRYYDKLKSLSSAVSQIGQFFSIIGMEKVGTVIQNIGSGISEFAQALNLIKTGGNVFDKISGWAGIATVVATGVMALVNAIRTPNWKKLQRDLVGQWGVNISDELAKTIEQDAKRFGGNWQAAMMHIADIAKEQGGVTAKNVEQWARRTRDAFSMVGMGWLTTGQAAEAIDSIFGDLVESGTDVNGVLNDQVRELITLEYHFKTGSKAIAEYIRTMSDQVVEGFNKVALALLGPWAKAFDELKNAEEPTEELTNKVKKLADQLDQGTFDRLGRLALVSFGTAIASGRGFLETLEALGPALDLLAKAQKEFGFESGEALGMLLRFREFSNLNPELIAGIDGLNQMMIGLYNIGWMTQGVFSDLSATATDLFNRLVQGGMSGNDAMLLMQPTLQRIWEWQRKFGYEVDESTQKLLDQAEEAGFIGEQHRSAMDVIATAVSRLVEIFELVFADKLVNAAKAGKDAVDEIGRSIENIPRNVDVNVNVNRRDTDAGSNGEVPAYASGAYVTTPHLAVVGEVPEYIIPASKMPAAVGPSTVVSNVYLDGELLTRAVSKRQARVLRFHGAVR